MIQRYRILCQLVMLLALTMAVQVSFAQFEGRIFYDLDYSASDPQLQNIAHFFPKQSELIISEGNTRFQQEVSGGAQQIYINNAKEGQSTLVMNFLGEAFKVKLSKENIESLQESPTFSVVYTGIKKTILGHDCEKVVSVTGQDTLIMYVDAKMYQGNMLPQYEGLQGLALEYETKQDGLTIHFKARELRSESVPNEWFHISDAIREVSFEDFARAFAFKKES